MRNSIFKKIASLIVAMCIVATLVPAAFATGETAEVLSTKTITFNEAQVTTYSSAPIATQSGKHYVFNNGTKYYIINFGDTTASHYDQYETYFPSGLNVCSKLNVGGQTYNVGGETIKGIRFQMNTTDSFTLKTKAPQTKPALYRVTVKYGMWSAGTTFALSLNGTELGEFNNKDTSATTVPVTVKDKVFESDTLFTPDEDGYLTIGISGSGNLWPYQIVIEEIADESASFSFAADRNSVDASTDKNDEYKFSETKASNGAESNPGYVRFEDDMYFTTSSAIRQLRLPNVSVYSSTNATDKLNFSGGRYTLVDNNWEHFYTYGCMALKYRLGTDGIYNISVTSGKNPRGGQIAVYANGIHIGNISDYQTTYTADPTREIPIASAELHTTDLKALRLTRDSDGYVELTFKAIGSTVKYVEFIPYSVDFELVETSEVAEPIVVSNTTVAAYVMNEVGGTIAETPVNSGAAGRTVTYTAIPADGYKFACWTDKDGKVLSEDSAYIFNAYTNMTVYANFDEKDSVGVKFYNGNGEFLKFVEKESGKNFAEYKTAAPTATYGGATFKGWSIADEAVINGVAYAVAQFEDVSAETVTATIKINGNPSVNGVVAIGQPIVCSNDEAMVWCRDGKYVSYGSQYTHYAFKNALLNYRTNAITTKAPVAILDDLGDGSYMFEYDGGEYTVLAAGVVFGNSGAVSVSSCYANAKARNIEGNHGQFKACVNNAGDLAKQSVARGYVVYSDNGQVKVLYADLD